MTGGGGEWHDACAGCCRKLAAPIGLSPLPLALSPNPLPPHAALPIGLSPPSARDLPVLPILTSCTPFPFLGHTSLHHPYRPTGIIQIHILRLLTLGNLLKQDRCWINIFIAFTDDSYSVSQAQMQL